MQQKSGMAKVAYAESSVIGVLYETYLLRI